MLIPIPAHPLEALQRLRLDDAVEPDDPRFVDLDAARGGSGVRRRLAAKFGLDQASNAFYPATTRHVLLFGPIGGGKSTELKRFCAELAAQAVLSK